MVTQYAQKLQNILKNDTVIKKLAKILKTLWNVHDELEKKVYEMKNIDGYDEEREMLLHWLNDKVEEVFEVICDVESVLTRYLAVVINKIAKISIPAVHSYPSDVGMKKAIFWKYSEDADYCVEIVYYDEGADDQEQVIAAFCP